MLKSKTDPKAFFEETCGIGWRVAMARAIGCTRQTLRTARPGQPVHTTLEVAAEFMAQTAIRRWPPRFAELRELAKAKAEKESPK